MNATLSNMGAMGTHKNVQRVLMLSAVTPTFLRHVEWLLTESCIDAPCAMPAGSVRAGLDAKPYLTCIYRDDI